MEQEATNVKVKDEPIEGVEYSEVKDGADIKKKRNESQVCPDPVKSTLNVKPAEKTEEEVVKKEPSDKDNNVKKSLQVMMKLKIILLLNHKMFRNNLKMAPKI